MSLKKMDKKFDEMIDQKKEIPMGEDELRAFIPNIKIIRYSDLKKHHKIEDLLTKPEDEAVILYQNAPYSGHWCCITRNDDKIDFYDSYGGKIDTQLEYITPEANKELGIDDTYLSNLINNSNVIKHFSENTRKHQTFKNTGAEINTCGRHCLFRLLSFKENRCDNKEYAAMMEFLKKKLKCSYDELVTGFINKWVLDHK